MHILENNEGLLLRDFGTYLPLYSKFGIRCSREIDAEAQICYCLKRGNQAYFSRRMQSGSLHLADTVLIVDEVERPSAA